MSGPSQPRYSKDHKEQADREDQPLFTIDLYYSKTGRRSTEQGVASPEVEAAIKEALKRAY